MLVLLLALIVSDSTPSIAHKPLTAPTFHCTADPELEFARASSLDGRGGLGPKSILLLTLLLLDLLLVFLISLGSIACNPVALAKRMMMSVRLTTPTR